jgi:hypothetical protein
MVIALESYVFAVADVSGESNEHDYITVQATDLGEAQEKAEQMAKEEYPQWGKVSIECLESESFSENEYVDGNFVPSGNRKDGFTFICDACEETLPLKLRNRSNKVAQEFGMGMGEICRPCVKRIKQYDAESFGADWEVDVRKNTNQRQNFTVKGKDYPSQAERKALSLAKKKMSGWKNYPEGAGFAEPKYESRYAYRVGRRGAESFSAEECNHCGNVMATSPCCGISHCPVQDFDCACEKHYGSNYPDLDEETGERYGNWEWSGDYWYQPKNAESFSAADYDLHTWREGICRGSCGHEAGTPNRNLESAKTHGKCDSCGGYTCEGCGRDSPSTAGLKGIWCEVCWEDWEDYGWKAESFSAEGKCSMYCKGKNDVKKGSLACEPCAKKWGERMKKDKDFQRNYNPPEDYYRAESFSAKEYNDIGGRKIRVWDINEYDFEMMPAIFKSWRVNTAYCINDGNENTLCGTGDRWSASGHGSAGKNKITCRKCMSKWNKLTDEEIKKIEEAWERNGFEAETFSASSGPRMYCPKCEKNRTWMRGFREYDPQTQNPYDFAYYICKSCRYVKGAESFTADSLGNPDECSYCGLSEDELPFGEIVIAGYVGAAPIRECPMCKGKGGFYTPEEEERCNTCNEMRIDCECFNAETVGFAAETIKPMTIGLGLGIVALFLWGRNR